MQTSSCTISATPVGAATTPEFFLDAALLNLDPCRFGAGLFSFAVFYNGRRFGFEFCN